MFGLDSPPGTLRLLSPEVWQASQVSMDLDIQVLYCHFLIAKVDCRSRSGRVPVTPVKKTICSTILNVLAGAETTGAQVGNNRKRP